ncbi:MAG: Uma2 family endonuclease [Thermosynechococcaceae cyanobacterium]
MTAVFATPLSQIELTPGSAIRINDVSWDAYIALLSELGDHRATRITYDSGVLEIKMPGPFHEVINRVLASIISTLAEEKDLDFNSLGSTTLNCLERAKGIEPDSCFYIQNARSGQGLDSTGSLIPPPDLALEVDIANPSESKLPIYYALGVPEIWLYRQGTVIIQSLQNGHYEEIHHSRVFPEISALQLSQWLQLRKTGTDLTVIKAVRAFCQKNDS